MKQISNIVAFILILTTFSFAQAQSCSDYYPMSKGTTYELTKYDKKDRLESVITNTVINFQKNGSTETATISSITTDKNGKESLNSEYTISCDGKGTTIDLNTLLKNRIEATQTNSDIESEITGTNPFTPNNLTVGQDLPDSNMKMDFHAGDINMSFGANSTDRKVVGKEQITVPAGTFDCIIITAKNEIKMLITKHTTSKIWIAEGVGVVKEETYNKKGHLESYEVLTKFNK